MEHPLVEWQLPDPVKVSRVKSRCQAGVARNEGWSWFQPRDHDLERGRKAVDCLDAQVDRSLTLSPRCERLFERIDTVRLGEASDGDMPSIRVSHSVGRRRSHGVVVDVPKRLDSMKLQGMGIPVGIIAIWDRNGIEYLYPASLLANIFGCSESQVEQLEIAEDNVSLNGVTLRKLELQAKVVAQLNESTPLPEELLSKLINPLASAIS